MSKHFFAAALLEWYEREKRDLPWRNNADAYHVWVSEIMLQQTKVDTVIPYYEKFIERFPTPQSLSEASEEEVLKYWEGLGYYSRARNLHTAVREVVVTYGGTIPDREEELRMLHGVGPYTVGAILSIAYNQPAPAVDGNVLRVLSRIYAIEDDIGKQATRKKVEAIVKRVIPPDAASSFNQALMELGALICVPRNPKCSICPVVDVCEAKALGIEHVLPHKTKNDTKKDIHLVTLVYYDGKRVLIRKREAQLLKNMWEFPSITLPNDTVADAQWLTQTAFEQHGVDILALHHLGHVRHVFSHLRWYMDVYVAYVERIIATGTVAEEQCVTIAELSTYPFPVPHQKVIALFTAALPH